MLCTKKCPFSMIGLLVSTALLSMPAMSQAADCQNIKFSDVGWTDITATTAVTSEILRGLGYKPKTQLLSVPVTYTTLANKNIDVFLGNWMPTMEGDVRKYFDNGSVESVKANLQGAKYTLAVPDYVYDAGVKSFQDLHKFADKFHGQIYGLEPGNDGNRLLQKMFTDPSMSLKDFKLVESSEAGMLSQLSRAVRKKQWIVFLGWEPHPMNTNFSIRYLSGGDEYFGPNFGGATIYTNVRKDYLTECPNVGNLLKNMTFSLDMESQIMNSILNEGKKPAVAAHTWLVSHQSDWSGWLSNVNTIDGKPGISAVEEYLSK
jgi:glycine betaine/proline transport system substrate-binding protein